MKKIFFPLFALFLLAGTASELAGKSPLPKEPAKKLIKFGWDDPTPEFLFKNSAEIERNLPYDGTGIGLALYKKKTVHNGKTVNLSYRVFSDLKFDEKWFEKDIEYLQKTRFTKLKYNFLNVSTAYFGKGYSIFNDTFWEGVNHNYALMAKIARKGGLAGLRIDLEDYGNMHKWTYRPYEGKSWDEAWNTARKRGQDFITAITKEFPDIKLFHLYFLDLALSAADGHGDIYQRLKTHTSGLLVAFINGIYDKLPPGAQIIDGMEHHGYIAKNLEDYCKLRAFRETSFRRLIAPENKIKLINQTSLAVATYLDSYIKKDSSHRKLAEELQMTPTELLRRNLAWAVAYSDEFSWTWGESRRWYSGSFSHSYQAKSLKRHSHVGTPYWPDALPGIYNAFLCAKDPAKYMQEAARNGRISENLLKNGSFDAKIASKGELPLAPDSVVYKKLPCWENWQHRLSKGKFGLAAGKGINGSNALMQSGLRSGVSHQAIKVKPYGLYIVRACAKIPGKIAGASMSVQFRNKKGRWFAQERIVSASFQEDLGDGWKRATLLIRELPEGIGGMSIMLGSSSTGSPEETVLFDNAEIFEVLTAAPETVKTPAEKKK